MIIFPGKIQAQCQKAGSSCRNLAKKRTASCNHGSDFPAAGEKHQVDHIGAANPGSLLQKLDKGWKSGFFSGIIKAVDA